MNKGFTLLELSIVLVIIGLIIGGITAGADLIRSAELNSAISEVNKFKIAVNTFKLKYNGLPGDLKNGNSYWVSVSNGDGNGKIDVWSTEGAAAPRALALAGLINEPDTISTAIPSNAISNAVYYFYYNDLYALGSTNGQDGNAITLAEPITSGPILARAISPSEAQIIDRKMDDGNATKGKTQGRLSHATAAPLCYVASEYNLAEEQKSCRMMFWLD